jgi:hypothetical protein
VIAAAIFPSHDNRPSCFSRIPSDCHSSHTWHLPNQFDCIVIFGCQRICILGASSAECVAKIKEDARVKRWVKACWIASLVKSNPSLSGFSIMDMHVSIVLAIV